MTMTHTTETRAAFSKILNDEIEQTQRLLDLLRKEYELLKGPPTETLEALLDEKKRQLEQVELCVSRHNRLLSQFGLTTDRQGTENFLQQCPDNAPLLTRWAQFTELLEQCRQQNEINGGAVQLNQHQVTQALDVLRGIAGGDKTYGPGGESRPTSTSKSLGKA